MLGQVNFASYFVLQVFLFVNLNGDYERASRTHESISFFLVYMHWTHQKHINMNRDFISVSYLFYLQAFNALPRGECKYYSCVSSLKK